MISSIDLRKRKKLTKAETSGFNSNLYTEKSFEEIRVKAVKCLRINEMANVEGSRWIHNELLILANERLVKIIYDDDGFPCKLERDLSQEEREYLGNLVKKSDS